MKLILRKKNDFDEGQVRTCKNCGREFQGRFCGRCGEKVIEPHERSVLFFLGSIFSAFTSLESRFLDTLKSVLFKPGAYSRDFANGIRQRYMKPVAFFFVANVIYFLFPLVPTFNTNLYSQTNLQFYSAWTFKEVERKLEERNISWEALNEQYLPASTSWSKTLLVFMVPAMALFYGLLHFSNKWFFSDHVLIGFEMFSFLLFGLNIIFPFFVSIVQGIGNWFDVDLQNVFSDQYTGPVKGMFLLYFFIFSEIRFYNQKKWIALTKSVFLCGATLLVVTVYRLFLFYITMKGI